MRISVVIPVLDGEDFLSQAIRAARNQTLSPVEIIVADNGSRDRSVEIARSFGPSVRVIHVSHRGAAAARASAATEATGDALMFLDADDLMAPDTLAHLAAALKGQDLALACCPWRRYEKVGACWRARPASCVPRRRGDDDLVAWLTGWYHPPCSLLWTRAAYEAAGGWDPSVRINQDGDLVMRALIAGVPLVHANGGVGYYRRLPGGQVSLSGAGRSLKGLEGRLDVLDKIEVLLRESGRAKHYAAPLAEAYHEIAQACTEAGTAAVCDRARLGVARNGGVGGLRAIRRTLRGNDGDLRRQQQPLVSSSHAATPARPAPEQTAPLVSIILPTYNRAATLDRAIASVLAQSYKNFELLVIDDGSTDATPALVKAMKDDRIRFLQQDENQGVAAARNRGLSAAKGRLIAFLDSDDAWMPAKLDRQVSLMQSSPERVGLIYTGLVIRQTGGMIDTWTPTARGNVLVDILRRNVVHFGTSSTMIRAEAAEAVGGFDSALPANEDHDYWARIARLYEFDYVPEPLTIYDQGGSVPGAEAKRSAQFERNMRARDLFVEQHGFEANRLGAAFDYQMNSARRHLEWEEGNPRAGRWLLLKSARIAPTQPLPYVWLTLSLIPRRPRAALVAGLRRLREHALPSSIERKTEHET
jgi:glycosyltransferase involved in cell wall biosynthesis